MSVRDIDDYLRHIQNNLHPSFIKMLAKEMKTKDEEIERLNNILIELEKWMKKEIFDLNGDYDYEGVVSGYENVLDKLQELKGSDKE